jgi:ribosomal protein L5
MDVSIITTAKNDKDGLTILKQFGLPFKIKVLIFKGNIL